MSRVLSPHHGDLAACAVTVSNLIELEATLVHLAPVVSDDVQLRVMDWAEEASGKFGEAVCFEDAYSLTIIRLRSMSTFD